MKLLGLILCGPSLFAWNYTGHRVIATLAYDRLSEPVRAKIDAILTHHPDYVMLRAALPASIDHDPRARAKAVFLAASVWPDQIRNDSRFYDETKNGFRPLLAGFPDMGRHLSWHYVRLPFSADGTPVRQPQPPNALSEITRIIAELANSNLDSSRAAYDLSWLIHLVGDVHQPLHTVSRFTAGQPGGDQGGNLMWVSRTRTLHELWDQIPGKGETAKFVAQLSRADPSTTGGGPQDWVEESYRIATTRVYVVSPRTSSKEVPIPLPARYIAEAKDVAKSQISKGGERLGVLLERIYTEK